MQSQVSSVSISRKSAIALADAHCHLDMFKDYKTVVNDAYMAGVRYMITAGGSAASSRAAIKIADGTNTFAVIGIDPAWAGRDDYFIKEIEDLIRSERKIRGIGEIGLDYRLTDFDKSVQEKAFVEQLKIAKKLDVPVVVHSRDAIEDAIKLVERSGVSKVVFHFFEGSPEQAKYLAEKGFFISIPPLESSRRKRIINSLQLSSIVVETDSPAVGENPIDVIKVIGWIAEMKGFTFEETAAVTTQTVKKLFDI